MFIAYLLIVTKNYKECRLLHVVNDKRWYFHTVEYYLAIKKHYRWMDMPQCSVL